VHQRVKPARVKEILEAYLPGKAVKRVKSPGKKGGRK